jgi:ribonuclease HI
MFSFESLNNRLIKIYTDGSCHTQLLIGAWAATIFENDKKEIIKGTEENTTHNRMELKAVIEALKHVNEVGARIEIYSDSQYVVNLLSRKAKFETKNFLTKSGNSVRNVDLVKELLLLIEKHRPVFIKVKAHQKNGDEHNREVDILVRQLVRKKAEENGK